MKKKWRKIIAKVLGKGYRRKNDIIVERNIINEE